MEEITRTCSGNCDICHYSECMATYRNTSDWCIKAWYYCEEDALRGGCENCVNWIPGPDLCRWDLPTGDDLTNCH